MIPLPLLGVGNFIAANWKPILLAVVVCGAYVKGCADSNARHEAFEKEVARIGAAQEKKSAEMREAGRKITKETNAKYAETKRQLDLALSHVGSLSDSLRKRPGGSILPPLPGSPGGGEGGEGNGRVICFARDKLRDGIEGSLRQFGERYSGLIQRGAGGIAGFQACAAWALEQSVLNSKP